MGIHPSGMPYLYTSLTISDNTQRYLHAKICWVEYCFEDVQRPSTNDCIVGILHIDNVEDNLLCPCIVNIAEGDRHSYLVECHNPSSSEVTEGVCCIMYLVILFLHLPESLRKDNVCCTTVGDLFSNAMNQEQGNTIIKD